LKTASFDRWQCKCNHWQNAARFGGQASMHRYSFAALTAVALAAVSPTTVVAQSNATDEAATEIAEITVRARRVANQRPAGTYAAPATTLRYDPLTELQSRGLAEGQSDVTVRGGIFENTGFKLGAVTVMDPQTGHYFAELPVDPMSMSDHEVVKGIDNAIAGFNSNIATVSYGLRSIDSGGYALVGVGSDNLDFQALRVGIDANPFGGAFSFARSEGDGSLPNGDHEFERYNLHLQRATTDSQTDVIAAYQDKFYGWPGAYTGFATLAETDDTQTTLLLANHRAETSRGWWEVGGYYRELEDDYDFDRTTEESGVPGSFEHKTRVYSLGAQGLYRSGSVDSRFGLQATADELVRSTDLTEGTFNERDYLAASVVPSFYYDLGGDRSLALRAGITADLSSADSNSVLPLLGFTLSDMDPGGVTRFEFDWAHTSQVPGYTVLKSRPAGLFGGNPDLGREEARQMTVSLSRDTERWQGRVAAFHRADDDLVDWTFSTGAPFARQANAVDIDVLGVELLYAAQWDVLEVATGYTYLDKDADYGSALVDASFYALNFARHRATLAIRYRFAEPLELRIDNEYRVQRDNPLRTSTSQTYLASLAIAWEPPGGQGFGAALTIDNLTDSDYQPFPGTPAMGRQFSLSAMYTW
jgi:hypothetical protein